MSPFEQCQQVESRVMGRLLLPLIGHASDGHFVRTDKGALARHLQLTVGDVLMNSVQGDLVALEIKAEVRYTGNLILELWSNRNLSDRRSHAERGMNPGWMVHCRADWLLYYFESNGALYVIDLFALKQWAFGAGDMRGHLFDYPERVQWKHAQLNETVGRIVPISDLQEALGRRIHLRGLDDVLGRASCGDNDETV
jgi:hypothetical protein